MSLASQQQIAPLPYRYRLFGLCVHSGIDLGRAGETEVTITRGAVPPLSDPDAWFEASPGRTVIDTKTVARFLVQGGNSIVVDGGVAASAALRWRLLGAAFGALLHQRGVLPLHTTVVYIGGMAVGLTGPSGAGKSTLAAFLCRRGHQLLIDDVCATGIENGQVLAEPGHGRLRLKKDAMTALKTVGGELLEHGSGKYELEAGLPSPERVRLRALVEIHPGEVPGLVRLDSGEALALWLRNTYYRAVLKDMQRSPANFIQCSRVSGLVPAFRLERPLDFGVMDRVAGLLEDCVAGLGA